MRKLGAARYVPAGTRRRFRLRRIPAAAKAILEHVFPHRELLLRTNGRVRFLRLGSAAQLAIAVTLLTLSSGGLYGLAQSFLFRDEIIAARNAELTRLAEAHRSFQIEAEGRNRHDDPAGLIEQNRGLQRDLRDMRRALQGSEAERREAQAAREALLTRLHELQASLAALAAEKKSLALRAGEAGEQKALAERARADELQERLIALQARQQDVVKRLSARTAGSIGELKELIAMTGLDADRLLGGIAIDSGFGGPFVEFDLDRDEPSVDSQLAALNSHIDQWDELQQVLRRLPLAAPVDNYVMMSPYGKRRDPINGQWAMHYGADLAGPPKAPILSAAPGVVVFVGSNGSYGRMVEIDHGMGIRTRYGHLASVTVRKGQSVGYRQAIGVIGSTGRSTGVHLHYEVLVNDTQHDPMRFIQAGKHVFKG